MWTIVAIIIAGAWAFFFAQARPFARTVDRGEVAILKPLAITYLALTAAFGFTGAWLMAFCSAASWLVNGVVGASLHKGCSFNELAGGTIQYMQKGPRLEPSYAESHRLARVLFLAATILGLLLFAALLRRALRWYVALPAAFVSAFILMVLWSFVIAYQPKKALGARDCRLDRSR
jgi:Na+/alanine symporter